MRHRFVLGLVIGVVLPWAASAQNPQPAAPQVVHPQVAPPGAATPVPEKVAPRDDTTLGDKTLSDKLAQQQGTLQPPSVDPGINARTPHVTGTMPVIPPPGTPGGNQAVQPK